MKYLFLIIGTYLIIVNLFQLWQYNQTILHYRDMNRKYYCSIYLNPHPTAFDMSLLDTNDRLSGERFYSKKVLFYSDTSTYILIPDYSEKVLFQTQIGDKSAHATQHDSWLKIETTIKLNNQGIWGGYIHSELKTGDSIKTNRIRMLNPITKMGFYNDYAFYVKIPPYFYNSNFKLFIKSSSKLDIDIKKISIQYLYKQE
jgi:hypothetical protein